MNHKDVESLIIEYLKGSPSKRITDRDNTEIKYSTVRISMIKGGKSKRVRDFRI